jgi:hypothetical protein
MSIPNYILKMKPSAYKSMLLGKYNKTDTNPKKEAELLRWKTEKWQNLTPVALGETKFYECGKKSRQQEEDALPSVCRPSIKVNKKTPKPLAKELSKEQIKKAIKIKKKGGRIDWDKL